MNKLFQLFIVSSILLLAACQAADYSYDPPPAASIEYPSSDYDGVAEDSEEYYPGAPASSGAVRRSARTSADDMRMARDAPTDFGQSQTRETHISHDIANEAQTTHEQVSDFTSSREILDQLTVASFAYNVPKQANIDDEIDITLLLNAICTPEELALQLPQNGGHTSGRVQISRVIEAKLDSRDFDITAITPTRQVIILDQNTKWQWSLKPLSTGPDKTIKITITAIVLVDGERTERFIDTYMDTISVNITTKQLIYNWISDYWEWAWSALLIPFLGFVWVRLRRKPSEPED